MKIKFYLLCISSFLLSFNIASSEMTLTEESSSDTITLPSSEILYSRLKELSLHHFLQKTKLHETLGGQEKVALGVAMAVELAIHDYTVSNISLATIMHKRKQDIIQCILRDFPEAIKELSDLELLDDSPEATTDEKK